MKTIITSSTLLAVLPLVPSTAAFGVGWSIPRPPTSIPNPGVGDATRDGDGSSTTVVPLQDQHQSPATTADATVATPPSSWRLVLDIGREELSSMPFDWARSGCRMPLVIPCDFDTSGDVQPRSDTVSFTGPDGAVMAPIHGGTWNILESSSDKPNDLTMTLSFPKALVRRDVTIDAGTTIQLKGNVFEKSTLDQLQDGFYQAREATWKIGEELNNMARRQGAPKKWNDETKQWEKRHANESILVQVQKRVQLLSAQTKQQQAAIQRPNPKTLSSHGSFPGIDEDMFVQKGGVITIPNGGGWRGGAVIGKWSAEPITDNPVSYYR